MSNQSSRQADWQKIGQMVAGLTGLIFVCLVNFGVPLTAAQQSSILSVIISAWSLCSAGYALITSPTPLTSVVPPEDGQAPPSEPPADLNGATGYTQWQQRDLDSSPTQAFVVNRTPRPYLDHPHTQPPPARPPQQPQQRRPRHAAGD